MAEFSAADSAFMARALRLAARGIYTAHPNPMVGCVVVRDGKIVGEGWHEVAGEAHAEINALRAAGAGARGATAYLTLEPCSHEGKTPPCAPALIEAGIGEVVIAMEDPFPAVSGNGRAALEAAGIPVRSGLMKEAAETLNAGFLSRVQRGLPFVRLKVASSLDGATAMTSGESQWITGPELEGLDTRGRQPIRAVLDSRLRMPVSAGMLAMPGMTVVYCTDDAARQPLLDTGAHVVRVEHAEGVLNVRQALSDLADREVNDLLVEAGPAVLGHLLSQRLVDELVIYQAPHIMGSETRPMFATPEWTQLADRRTLDITDLRRIGRDIRITARVVD
jgi:diaminohydroxyphosphoribosylaminopyrimidine deaminase/5-amino-6-(5-phosphoribosylamino)uracil reductase